MKSTQTLLVAQLDGSLDKGVQLFVFVEEAVLELTGLFCAHPEDLGQTLATCKTKTHTQQSKFNIWGEITQADEETMLL